MDDELFDAVYHIAFQLWPRREKRVQYAGRLIVLMYYWSVIRNKPRQWVCDPRNLPRQLTRWPIPSRSQFGRRLNSAQVQAMLDELEQQVREVTTAALIGYWLLDAKPLTVSPYSKDKHATWGWGYDRKVRGYKLFVMTDARGNIIAWHIAGMNVAEPTAARELIPHIDRPGYLIGDSIYDSNPLHRLTAPKQVQLIAPRKLPGRNIGAAARHPNRLHAIDMLETFNNGFGPAMYAQRTAIERSFSRLASSRVGLDHLPGFIRTPARVHRWVQAKIALDALVK